MHIGVGLIYSNKLLTFYIPNKEITVRPSDKPWMNGLIRWSIRRRDRLLKRFSNNKTLLRWERYRTQRNLVVKLIRKAKIEYQKKTEYTSIRSVDVS